MDRHGDSTINISTNSDAMNAITDQFTRYKINFLLQTFRTRVLKPI